MLPDHSSHATRAGLRSISRHGALWAARSCIIPSDAYRESEVTLMATTVPESFRQFATNTNITDRQEGIVANCKANIVAALQAQLEVHPSEEARVIGSWDRDTLIRTLAEGDVDVMIVLHYGKNEGWYSAAGTAVVLERFRVILQSAYPTTVCKVDRNCVTMKLQEFRLDVVPAFAWNTGNYKIPDADRREWVETNPITFAAEITRINKRMNGTFVPLIKMIKAWNREIGRPLRGFHLECVLQQHYSGYNQGYTYESMLPVFFRGLPGYLGSACYDPVTRDRVDGYLDADVWVNNRARAIKAAERASAEAAAAHELGARQPVTAIKAWKELFGEFFPAYG